MKNYWFVFILVTAFTALSSAIVINEICYDPIGADDGYEWIELYNNGTEEVNLIGWSIDSAGTEFSHDFTFTSILLRPGRFLVIAEDAVENAHIHTDLSLQNAGDAVDGVRLNSPSGDYSDTVLYGNLNLNNLPDDNQIPGTSFAPDASQGFSLARIPNGMDTNLCAQDFRVCSNPTPGSRNIHEVDLAIKTVEVTVLEDSLRIYTVINNLSTSNVDNSEALLRISVDNTIIHQVELSGFNFLSIADTTTYIDKPSGNICFLSVEVFHEGELNPVDNLWTTQVFLTPFSLFFCELFPAPLTGEQEWIELYNPSKCMIPPSGIYLEDWTGNSSYITKTLPAFDYIVLCTDSLALVNKYPACPVSAIVELEHIPILNNNGDGIRLKTAGVLLDSVSYSANEVTPGCSVIRSDYLSPLMNGLSHPESSSPGQPNPINPGEVYLQVSITGTDVMTHRIFIHTDTPLKESLFSCTRYDILQDFSSIVYETRFPVDDTLSFSFISDIPSEGMHNYIYTFQGYSLTKCWYQDLLPAVVNEIMYDPLMDEPEWLELFSPQPGNYSYQLIISQDTLTIELMGQDYIILTGTAAEADELINDYALDPTQVITGLPNLNNQGESIRLKCIDGNKEELFTYEPDWSPTKGISIERINPYLNPGNTNWTASVDPLGATPGAANSVFREFIPATSRIELENNPFSPYRDEQLMIKFMLESASAVVDCIIYDLKGRTVAHPAKHQSITGNDAIVWNGRTGKGKNVIPGAYLLLVTLDENGRITRKQFPLAVGK